jgi:16S rRNA (cytosine1402-N4)-methyltransferase
LKKFWQHGEMPECSASRENPAPHRRRPRYSGKNPRRFQDKYKEHDPARYPEAIDKVLATGKTPAGSHRPIMVAEVLAVLAPKPGEIAIDCTLGYGGHAREIMPLLRPDGHLYGLDVDPIELIKTEERLRAAGFGPDIFSGHRTNFAGLPQLLTETKHRRADLILADLGLSSMQLDDPMRGFSMKEEGPLDMRMNPARGQSASAFLARTSADRLADILQENADEPNAEELAHVLTGKTFATTHDLARAVRRALSKLDDVAQDLAVRRVFQAIRIAVNDEFSALEMLLRRLPDCLTPNGRAAIITFHSGEDRRVKKAFQAGARSGLYAAVATEVIRAGPEERRANPRSIAAKLRWVQRAGL